MVDPYRQQWFPDYPGQRMQDDPQYINWLNQQQGRQLTQPQTPAPQMTPYIDARMYESTIAECRAERDPNAWTAMRWAAFLTIKCIEFGHPDLVHTSYAAPAMPSGASFAAPAAPEETTIEYSSKTEFGTAIAGKRAADIWPIIDELMTITRTLHPEIYDRVMELVK